MDMKMAENKDEIIKLFNDGANISSLAKKYDVSRNTVYAALRKWEIEPTDRNKKEN